MVGKSSPLVSIQKERSILNEQGFVLPCLMVDVVDLVDRLNPPIASEPILLQAGLIDWLGGRCFAVNS